MNDSSMPDLALPDDIEICRDLGSGRRSHVCLAKYLGRDVAVKIYKPHYIEKYQKQYKVNIGEFEYGRNKRAFDDPALSRYIAEPYRLLMPSEGYKLALVQEYVKGRWLKEFMQETGSLPVEVLQAGYKIVAEAARLGMYDLDISLGNILIQQNQNGQWQPKLYDFNLMPQHMCPPNPFMALGFMLGLRSKNHRDYRSLKNWQAFADNLSKK